MLPLRIFPIFAFQKHPLIMNILLLGNGGREHALAIKLSQSPLCEQLFIAPGNAGTTDCGINLPISPTDFPAVKDAALENGIQMVVVGPEAPLVDGIWDFFQSDPQLQHIVLIGPSAQAAQLEGSKAYAKAFMQEYYIPTAAYLAFSKEELPKGLEYIERMDPPIVLKADGLAGGKGVLICEDREQAKQEFAQMLGGKFGVAGEKIVIESFLKGTEFSVFVLTDGVQYQILPVAKDYKRIGEGDTGLNTGGMGCVSPPPFVSDDLMQKVRARIIEPTLRGIQERGLNYRGFLFLGLMEVQGDPYVIEYNCRLGDPETQVVLPRIQNDLVSLLLAMHKGKLEQITIRENEATALAVIMVSGGYPGTYEKGKPVRGLENLKDVQCIHAGTRREGNEVLTNGGRVLALVGMEKDIPKARETVYEALGKLDFENHYFRKDIGEDLL